MSYRPCISSVERHNERSRHFRIYISLILNGNLMAFDGVRRHRRYDEAVGTFGSKSPRNDRAYAVAAAAARDFNNELTVIVSSVAATLELLEEDHPARVPLEALQGAAQRCIWKAAGLLRYSSRRGLHPSSDPMESIIDA